MLFAGKHGLVQVLREASATHGHRTVERAGSVQLWWVSRPSIRATGSLFVSAHPRPLSSRSPGKDAWVPFNACSLTRGHHLNAADPGGKGGMQGHEDHGFYDDMWSVESPKVLVGGWNGAGRMLAS